MREISSLSAITDTPASAPTPAPPKPLSIAGFAGLFGLLNQKSGPQFMQAFFSGASGLLETVGTALRCASPAVKASAFGASILSGLAYVHFCGKRGIRQSIGEAEYEEMRAQQDVLVEKSQVNFLNRLSSFFLPVHPSGAQSILAATLGGLAPVIIAIGTHWMGPGKEHVQRYSEIAAHATQVAYSAVMTDQFRQAVSSLPNEASVPAKAEAEASK